MAVYGMHNPERDYQDAHYKAVWEEVERSKIIDKVLQMIQSNMSEGDAKQFIAIRDSLRNAVAPIEWDKLMKSSEVMFTQKMQGPTSLHLILIRVPDGGAESFKKGIVNLFDLASGASQGQIPVVTETIAGVEMKFLQLPREVPITFQPAVGVKGDIVVLTTSLDFAEEGLTMLGDPSRTSKFEDPRFVTALSHLPKAEDSLVVFDATMFFEQLKGVPQFISAASQGDPNAKRVVDIMTQLITEMDAIDYEVTVEYTDGFRNCSASYGKVKDGADATALGKMVGHQQPFTNWTKWVPSSSTGFSLNSGINLVPLYDWAMETIPATFPEAQEGLDHFAAVQNQFDVHLKEDILEAFSGESASITLPGAMTPFGPGTQSVMFLRCSKPDRVQELIHRGFNALEEIPQVKAQGITLKEVEGMEGFDELSANFFALAGIKPVMGFRDGWMVIASHKEAVETALATQAGEGESWASGDRYKQFALDVNETAYSVSYENTGESIRGIAMGLQQAGTFAPMIIGMAGAQNQGGDGPDLKAVQEVLALLPSIGRIIGKFDFIDATMSATVAGEEAGSYRRDSVTLIKPAPEAASTEATPAR